METQKTSKCKPDECVDELTIDDTRFIFDGANLSIWNQPAEDPESEPICSLDVNAIGEIRSFLASLHLLDINRREAYRVPLHECNWLTVSIRCGGESIAVIPKTISVTGIFVAPPPGRSLDLSEGDAVDITLGFEGQSQKLDALVRRCQPGGFGLFFKDSMTGEQIDPPPQLSRIVMELQRRIMNRRARNT